MSPVTLEATRDTGPATPVITNLDDRLGTFGMALLIATEATLFTMLFAAYFYMGSVTDRWQVETPPRLHYAIPMLVVLLISSGTLHWGEVLVRKGRFGAARLALIATILLGIGFVVMSYFEYLEEWQLLTPRTDSYGSIFFTIVSLHLAHVVVGLVMLIWLLLLGSRWEPVKSPPHHPFHNVSMYWHFVDTVWIFVVAILYVYPNIAH